MVVMVLVGVDHAVYQSRRGVDKKYQTSSKSDTLFKGYAQTCNRSLTTRGRPLLLPQCITPGVRNWFLLNLS